MFILNEMGYWTFTRATRNIKLLTTNFSPLRLSIQSTQIFRMNKYDIHKMLIFLFDFLLVSDGVGLLVRLA